MRILRNDSLPRPNHSIHGNWNSFNRFLAEHRAGPPIKKQARLQRVAIPEGLLETTPIALAACPQETSLPTVRSLRPQQPGFDTAASEPTSLQILQCYQMAAKPAEDPFTPIEDLPGPPSAYISGRPIATEEGRNEISTSWLWNQQQSPFLRLPKRVRGRIYKHLYKCQAIEINYISYKHEQKEEAHIVHSIFKYRIQMGRDEVDSAPLDLRARDILLNGVCRQLYQETSKLIFLGGTMWKFHDRNHMFNYFHFDKKMRTWQRNLIKYSLLYDEAEPDYLLKLMPGLKVLGILNMKPPKSQRQKGRDFELIWYNVKREGDTEVKVTEDSRVNCEAPSRFHP
ncbi:hypothetical protein M011DRAFT_463748 [Sporormia fimetaria CBS 119925]|uniref:Uncharacterized protein n=1 Tax=Sporormia fimetaria CBS 119925 TaxID=1340428 RepID=A0A6A6VQW2_9PLEO|nr:hypothetical protein M011DRAFT_463748 [Sporormia fimetaria CBS 119925]